MCYILVFIGICNECMNSSVCSGIFAVLAAWFRLKYPHVAIGALASSSSILNFGNLTSPFTFNNIVTQDFRVSLSLFLSFFDYIYIQYFVIVILIKVQSHKFKASLIQNQSKCILTLVIINIICKLYIYYYNFLIKYSKQYEKKFAF